jgi:hypothetical protein
MFTKITLENIEETDNMGDLVVNGEVKFYTE